VCPDKPVSFSHHVVRLFEKIAPELELFYQLGSALPNASMVSQPLYPLVLIVRKTAGKYDMTASGYSAVIVCHVNMGYFRSVFP